VLESKGIYVNLVAPEVSRFVSTGGELPDIEEYRLPGYGFILPKFAESALPNCFRDLSSKLVSTEWKDFKGLKVAPSV